VERAVDVMVRLTRSVAEAIDPLDPAMPADHFVRSGVVNVQAVQDGRESAREVTCREMARELLCRLSAEARRAVAEILTSPEYSGDDPRCKDADVRSRHESLERIRVDGLDKTAEGFVSFNLDAPLRGIVEEVEHIAKAQKEARGGENSRRRPDVLNSYLDVWDRREGWAAGRYDKGAEKTLKAIAEETGSPLQTVDERYRSAYRLVFGEQYDPLRWAYWFRSYLKLSPLKGRRKPKAPAEVAPSVTETTLGAKVADVDSPGVVESAKGADEAAYRELLGDLKSLIDKGGSDAEIIAELDLSSTPPEAIQLIRSRGIDGLL
jgi:hypothetical protein